MTTKTRPSIEHAKLTAARDKAHDALLAIREKLDAWNSEGMPPGVVGVHAETFARRREAEHGPNPHREDLEAANAEFELASTALDDFMRQRVADRIEEVTSDGADIRLREILTALRDWADEQREKVNEVRRIVVGTPGLTGQDYGHDPRVNEFETFAREHLRRLDNEEYVQPGLNPLGAYRAEQHV